MKTFTAVKLAIMLAALATGGCGRHNGVYFATSAGPGYPPPAVAPAAMPAYSGYPNTVTAADYPNGYPTDYPANYAAPPVAAAMPQGPVMLAPDQINQIVAPIALYPDPLLAVLLPAACYLPDDQAAAAFLAAYPQPDEPTIAAQNWDPSVKALISYAEALQMLVDHPDWTNALGAAFVNQPGDVMSSIQRLRQQALTAQTLRTSAEMQVVQDNGVIEVFPGDPQNMWVPQYDPAVVFVTVIVDAYPIRFGRSHRIGRWMDNSCDWNHRWVAANTGWQRGWQFSNQDRHWHRDNNVVSNNTTHNTPYVRTAPTTPWRRDTRKAAPVLPASLARQGPVRTDLRGVNAASSAVTPAGTNLKFTPTGKPFTLPPPKPGPGLGTPNITRPVGPVGPVRTNTIRTNTTPPVLPTPVTLPKPPPTPTTPLSNFSGTRQTGADVRNARSRFQNSNPTPAVTPTVRSTVTPTVRSTVTPTVRSTVTPTPPPVHVTPTLPTPPTHFTPPTPPTPPVHVTPTLPTPPTHFTPPTTPTPAHVTPTPPPPPVHVTRTPPPPPTPRTPPAIDPNAAGNAAAQSARGHGSLKH